VSHVPNNSGSNGFSHFAGNGLAGFGSPGTDPRFSSPAGSSSGFGSPPPMGTSHPSQAHQQTYREGQQVDPSSLGLGNCSQEEIALAMRMMRLMRSMDGMHVDAE
jgi:hypothetical protein